MRDESILPANFHQGISSDLPRVCDIEPAISLQNGDNHTYATAKMIAGCTADFEEFKSWMVEWNKQCKPPWPPARLMRNIRRGWKATHDLDEGVFYVPEAPGLPRVKTRRVNFEALNEVAFKAKGAFAELLAEAARSATPPLEQVIDEMYPGNPLLCRAAGSEVWARTAPRESFRGAEAGMEWIVPSPMSKAIGTTMDGENDKSPRCRDNAGKKRRYIVVEFDFTKKFQVHIEAWAKEGISTKDVQAALICHLATTGEPRQWPFLIVGSGGKSLHSWYAIHRAFSEQNALDLLSRAIPFGADPKADEPERFFRFPGGTRKSEKGQPQPILFYDRTKLAPIPKHERTEPRAQKSKKNTRKKEI